MASNVLTYKIYRRSVFKKRVKDMDSGSHHGPSKRVQFVDQNYEEILQKWNEEIDSGASDMDSDAGYLRTDHDIESLKKEKPLIFLKLFGSKQHSNLSEKKVSEIDNALIKMITKDYQPLSLVENAGFLEYSKALQPLYTPPSRKKLTYDLLPQQYEEATSTLIKIIIDVKYISVTTDIWTSDSNKAYITVTGHFIFKSVLRAHVLSTRELPGSHTGENISLMLGDIFKHWKIENKIIAVVSDNGSNIKSAISNYLQIFHLPCVAHTLNLIVTKSLMDVAELNDILKKCRALVNHFKHSSLAYDKLRSVQEQMGLPNLKVKQEVVTRWNSCFHMLQRLLEIKNPLCVAVANLSKPPEFLNADDWEVINDCIKVLKQADDITRLLSSENYPTVSLLIPIIRGIQFALQNTTVVTNSLKLKLLQTIHQRLGSFESSKTIAKATFLDPRFKKDGFGNEENANNAEKRVTDEIKLILSKKTESTASPQLKTNSDQTNQPSTENLNIWTHFDRKVSEKRHFSNSTTTAIIMIRQYLELPLQKRNKDPLEFWTKHQILLPEFSKVECRVESREDQQLSVPFLDNQITIPEVEDIQPSHSRMSEQDKNDDPAKKCKGSNATPKTSLKRKMVQSPAYYVKRNDILLEIKND
ncbi:E3 SUMO-protein ligase ZBED1-like [Diabrotica undecimpunctata]|uniref:E3 SUMO-protein ligase ZBED1-like n=1 Tax=Diabrotica undecimpunctata TaxID=50387 RepID=UPI003B633D6B